MGAIVQGNRLSQAGSLRFRVLCDGNDDNSAVRPCLLVGPAVYGDDLRFSLVSWQVSGLSPEQPLSPTYDYFKVYLRSANRLSGTTADCHILIHLTTGVSMLSGA